MRKFPLQIAILHKRRFLSIEASIILQNLHGTLNLIQSYIHYKIYNSSHIPRLNTKIGEKISELDGIHTKINDVYSCGAVEGYSEEHLVFMNVANLL